MTRAALLVVALCAGCPPPAGPTPADTAKYLGLDDGKVYTYAVAANVSETHEVHASTLLADAKDNPGGLVFDLVAKQNGFVVEERTFSVEVAVDSARIVRFGDCIQSCGQPNKKIDLFATPLKAGDSHETEIDVANTDNGTSGAASHETHTFVVGDQGDIDVPAGSFSAFTVSWTRIVDGAASQIATIRIAPDDGVVTWDGFNGDRLQLTK